MTRNKGALTKRFLGDWYQKERWAIRRGPGRAALEIMERKKGWTKKVGNKNREKGKNREKMETSFKNRSKPDVRKDSG